jgi:starch synthase
MEFHGSLNLLKTGMVFSDSINTVSPRYAQEIQSSPLGCGLEGVLQNRQGVLSGILNGIDPHEWDPATDPHLPANYNADTVAEGKPICKAALRKELGLPQEPAAPLVGMVGRLIDQKGLDLVSDVLQRWVQTSDVQWAILGTGQPKYHKLLETLTERFPQRVAARLKFSNPLAHRIEAGADMFLMPSRFEPCGLNQMYSLKYGTVPVVRATGGLADTITGFDPQSPGAAANGFVFREYSGLALSEILRQACDAYRRPEVWKQLVRAGMGQDWTWARSAKQYVELYQKTIERGTAIAN